jgi:hypothetical protein
MADSGSLRVRRHRLHLAGDHSLCRHCDARSVPAAVPVAGDAGVNPLESLQRLARRLESAHEADPADAAVARELRATLATLAGMSAAADDGLEDLRELARVP